MIKATTSEWDPKKAAKAARKERRTFVKMLGKPIEEATIARMARGQALGGEQWPDYRTPKPPRNGRVWLFRTTIGQDSGFVVPVGGVPGRLPPPVGGVPTKARWRLGGVVYAVGALRVFRSYGDYQKQLGGYSERTPDGYLTGFMLQSLTTTAHNAGLRVRFKNRAENQAIGFERSMSSRAGHRLHIIGISSDDREAVAEITAIIDREYIERVINAGRT